MRYTVITPTMLRPTLDRLCDSLDAQTYDEWQHIVAVDQETPDPLPPTLVDTPSRRFVFRDGPGSANVWERVASARHAAWDHAAGDYLLYIDDDNYLADEHVLETLLEVRAPVALFPLCYHGELASPLPIRVGRSDGNGLMVERLLGRWPLPGNYADDGELIVRLTTDHPYEVVAGRALVVYEYARLGAA